MMFSNLSICLKVNGNRSKYPRLDKMPASPDDNQRVSKEIPLMLFL